MARLFDLVVMVDWSAASTPGPARETKDQIWLAWGTPRQRAAPLYCRTRHAAFLQLRRLLVACRGNALVGFDFPHGYPRGAGLGGGRAAAKRLARLIEDAPDNGNNRFAVAARLNREMGILPGPFWACPAAAAQRALQPTKPDFAGRPYREFRIVEERLRARKKWPQSVWKLYTTGSVGSQALTGLPVIHKLLTDPALAMRSRVWPFETRWDKRLDGIIHSEIWPSLFPLDLQRHHIKDARQVMAVRDALLDNDGRGALRPWFARPESLSNDQARICRDEEGWILGVR